ncbi:hypothetical protein PHYSODRAFT_298502 [Phytophthora sojae]|uniref:Uncharacterized protein n=1 Tax=Phytophthora sojae (strain P6497) TaxID=1094619 RepID=G4Z6R0_PHYSP|nr:hypothetical protein PHYSODRAFT_298502 [Phytophthora sojae]EGZ20326.1 hypothetical protein PHYSODRAFT_298502 [Phytophthora sojae]|eukprot:XP_009523043.1 hypothetical protein PHYSODRAFT_298502 [Phytophthora sojae]
MPEGPPGPRFQRGWSPHRDEWGHHEHHGDHEHHDEDNDDDEDSKDDNDDDEDDSDSSQSSSASNSKAESAAIQSSVVTNLDGINIGNTITIINIGTGSQGNSSGSADDYGYAWNEKTPSDDDSLPVSDSDRSAITSAAVRAFCESIDCSRSKSFKDTATAGGPAPMMPAFSAGNREVGTDVQHETPAAKSSCSAMNANLARWLVIIAIIIQLR